MDIGIFKDKESFKKEWLQYTKDNTGIEDSKYLSDEFDKFYNNANVNIYNSFLGTDRQYDSMTLINDILSKYIIVENGVLNDAWTINGIPRTQYKYSCTPRLYGSSQECYEIWQDKGIPYTMEQVTIFNTEITTGALSVADAYKDFLINNSKPTETLKIKAFNEEFKIECNRYRNVGDYTTLYDIFDTETNSIRRILNTKTKSVADLDQFRRYFPTGLIHNVDSQAANYVSQLAMEKYGWLIDIYDAFIVHPNMARDIRKWYGEFQKTIYNNRDSILRNYHLSIGIGPEAETEWQRVKELVHPIVGDFNPHYMALK